MAFNYATGMYEADPGQQQGQPQNGPTMDEWLRLAGFNQGAQAMATGQPNYPDPNRPNPNAPGTGSVPAGSGATPPWTPPPGAAPTPPMTQFPNAGDGRVGPSQNGYGIAGQQAAGPTAQMMSTNPGTDVNRPPDSSKDWFWSNTAGHWVDSTGQRDATGRLLGQGEKDYWTGMDHARASAAQSGEQSLLTNYMAKNTNPGLVGPAQYGASTQTAPVPGQPAAAPAAAPSAQADGLDPAWDYSKVGGVPWQAFVKNLFADTNAQQSFKELQVPPGQVGLTPQQIEQASKLYGWQPQAGSSNPDANVVYRQAIQVARADPGSDYSVVKMQDPATGQLSYGVMKRSQSTATQEAGGYYAPGSNNPNSPANQARAAAARQQASRGGGGGGNGGGPTGPSGPTQGQVAGAQGLGKGVANVAAHLLTARDKQFQQMGVQEQAKYNARYQGTGNLTADAQRAQEQARHDATLAAQKKLLDAMNVGAGSVTVATPGNYHGQPTQIAPAGSPPEGAVMVNPDDSRSVWHNGHWVQVQ